MSAVAAPPPKTAGSRPPILPPIRTTFDGGDQAGGEPYPKRVEASVRVLLKAVKEAEPDAMPLLRGLIDQRRKMVEYEIMYERMMQPAQPMPPPLFLDLYGVDLFPQEEEEPIRLYQRLLLALEDAAAHIDRTMAELNRERSASLLIDAGFRDAQSETD